MRDLPQSANFQVMRKQRNRGNTTLPDSEPGERAILDGLAGRLTALLPDGWSIHLLEPPNDGGAARGGRDRPDAELVLRTADGQAALILVEVKRRLDPKLVPVVVDQLERYARRRDYRGRVVAAAHLSPRARALLTEAGLGYADATGNLRLVTDRPAVFVATEGAASDPWSKASDRPLRSLKGPTAGRVVRALCDFRPPYGVEELARRSGTSLGSVSRVFAFLDREGLITREPRGPVVDVKWADLIRRWTEDYSFARANATRSFLEPRGLPALLGKVKDAPSRYAVTGSLAAAQVAPVAAPRLATLYVERADAAAEGLGLRPAETAANVVLAEPFDSVVFDRTREHGGVIHAAPSQVAADLLTGPGRSPAEGEELLRWMEENQDAWRA
jgi:hypothetical protein